MKKPAKRFLPWVLASCLASLTVDADLSSQEAAITAPPQAAARPTLPIDFVENRGQWTTDARFVARQGPVTVALEPHAIRLQLGKTPTAMAMVFEGASAGVTLAGEGKQPGIYNYYFGNNASAWRTGVPAYSSVIYKQVYDGVDIRVREQSGLFEYDLLLSPRTDLSRVVIRADGASRLELQSDGALVLHTPEGPLRQTPPHTMEVLPSGSTRVVASAFRIIDAQRYGFEVPERNDALPLVIDPGLEWSTLIGGSGSDPVGGVTHVPDGTGDVIVAGWPNSADYPTLPGSGSPGVNNSVAVLRLNSTGTALRYATFFGGWHSQLLYRGAVAVNTAGDVVVGGEAYPADFPTTPGAFDRVRDGDSSDGFVTRLNAAGEMTASTFLGGVFSDSVATVAFAPNGSVIAGGNTTSSDFPTTAGAFDRTYNVPNASSDGGAHGDMFIARLSADLSALTYGTFIGGPSLDVLEDIAVDPLGFVNVTGWVTGNNVQVFVSTPGAFDASWNGSQDVAFARLKLDGGGAADLKYATLMGGSNEDNGVAVAFAPNNSTLVTVAGHSWSDNFPVTPGVIKPTNPRFSDLFEAEAGIVAHFQFPASGGGTRLWSTYFGSEGFERASEEIRDVVINSAGEVIIAGKTDRTAFPTTRGAYDRTHAGGSDGFVARINGSGTQLLYSTFFGGADSDDDLFQFTPLLSYVGGNTVLVAGSTGSADFPVSAGTLQDTHGNPEAVGTPDTYVLRLALDADASGDLSVAAPVPLSPANGSSFARNGYVVLTWSEVSDSSGVDSYEYQVSPKPDFPENFLHYKSSVSGTSARMHESLALIQWYWRVRTADRAGNLSEWSPISTFTLGAADGRKSVTAVGILPSAVVGGESATGLVYLTGPAPPGGVVVNLSVHHSTAFTFGRSRRSPLPINVPATVTVPAGATQVYFTATTAPVTKTAPGAILATVDGVGQFGFLAVEPPGTTGTIRLDFTPMTVAGGKNATGTVTLGAPAPAGGQLVTIASQHPFTARASVTSITVPEGATSATFPVTTSPVTVAVDASFAVVSNRATWATTLRVRPSLPRLLSLSFSPSTVPGGQNVTGTLTVSAPMISSKWPAGPDELVRVWSSDPLAADTGSQFGAIAGGATSGTFTAFTRGLPTTRTVTFFAALDDVVVSAPLTVQAAPTPALSSVTFQPSTVSGGQGGIGRVNLSAATTRTVFVPLSSNSPGAVSMPSGVTLFTGDTSSMFSFTTADRSTAANVNVTATFGSASATGTLTINPSVSVSTIPLASLSVDRLTTPSGTPAIGTATLTSAARPGGVTVRLGTSDFNVAEVPFEIVVPGGATSANFTITTKSVTAPSDVIIHGLADNTGLGQSAGLTVTPGSAGPTLSSLSLSPTSVTGGTSSTGTVTLSAAAPSGGRVVVLSSSNTAAATVPASVTVASGTTSRTFTVTTQTVASSTSTTITGTLGSTRTATLTVNAAPSPTPAAPTLVSPANLASVTLPVTLDWNDVTGAASYQIQVDNQSTFSAPRVIDQTVTTSQFTVTSVPAQRHWWRVRGRNSAGTNGAWSSVRSFTPQSAPAPAALSAVSVNPSSVVGGNGSQGTVTLTAAAPSGGFAVSLSSSNTVATVPANVTVAQGSTTATFAIGTSAVTTSTPVTITASNGTATRTATLTVVPVPPPAALSAVSVSPASVAGGNGSQGTVTLTAAAPSGGFSVSLSSSNSVATVPASVTVAQGSTTATFAIGTSAVTTSTPVTITASAGTATRTASLTVTPPSQTATLTVTATGRSGERVTTSPTGINVSVGSSQSASFTTGTSITLSVTDGRDAIFSGACSTGGNKQRTCTFTFNANGTVTANVQ